MAERVRITAGSGRVSVIGESRDTIDVDGAPRESEAGETVVRGRSGSLVVRVPAGTDVVVGSTSGGIDLDGPLGAVSVTTTSASVHAADVASIDARTSSGDLRVDQCRGPMRLTTTSARIGVGRVDGEARLATTSGKIEVASANAGVSAKTVSGTINVHVDGREPVQVETVSGKITVTVPDGVRPTVRHRTVSGKRRVEPDTGDDLVISARTVSGKVTVGVA
jgi:DUF4097 and DUF4098 domain-containing protein YvlB